MKSLFLRNDTAEYLKYYLSRSVFWDGDDCVNIVAEEAECGNELSTKAMKARIDVLEKLREK